MRKMFLSMLCTATLVGAFAGEYKVTVSVPEDMEGAMAYIVNLDNGENLDSILVEDGIAEFAGTIESPLPARIIIDGNRVAQFILEDGDIKIDPKNHTVTGGSLNKLNEEIELRTQELSMKFQNATTNAEQEAIYDQYEKYTEKILSENLDNPVGYFMFMNKAYDFTPDELEAFLAANPYFMQYARVQNLLKANRRKAATGEGAMFADFEIEYEGVKHKLSDIVGKGDYVLVDFWASWCGPCIRQTAVLKDIYKEYNEDGLKVLGVAVWDEPENTKKAIVQHELPWESWLNGGNVPTDVYGISGIPCIILFGPDGTILSRDKQDDGLRNAVRQAMATKNSTEK